MRSRIVRGGIVLGALLVVAAIGLAQRGGRGGGGFSRGFGMVEPPEGPPIPVRDAEFHFLRMEYRDIYRRGYGYVSREGMGRGWWLQDWPSADNHFTTGITRLTKIDVGDPRHLGLMDPKLFDYPWMYATQVGYWTLSDAEIARLREYLLRGGFLMTDDFWGTGRDSEEWEVFSETMQRVLPGQPITDLSQSDPVMHVLYDIKDKELTAIPGSRHLRRGANGDVQIVLPQGEKPAWLAIHDDKGYMVVAVNYNTDIGDAWEFADVPYYPADMTMLAYRYAVNYVIYAMTH